MRLVPYVGLMTITFLVGCGTTKPPQVVEVLPSPSGVTTPPASHVQTPPAGAQESPVVVQNVRRLKTDDGFPKAQIEVKNVATTSSRIRYRLDWVKADGEKVVDPDHDAWEKLQILPGGTGTIQSIAPQRDCVDFKLSMKLVQATNL